jgi:YHS domain-containing protein
MIRLLVLAALIYFGGKYIKKLMKDQLSTGRTYPGRKDSEIDDIMIQDPVCGVYFPKRNGIRYVDDGKQLYFCSEECKNKYIEEQK